MTLWAGRPGLAHASQHWNAPHTLQMLRGCCWQAFSHMPVHKHQLRLLSLQHYTDALFFFSKLYMCLKPVCPDTGFLAVMSCPLNSCQCCAASKQRQAQQGPVASSREQSQEGHCICLCIPTPGYRGVQEDESLAEGTVLRSP